ncbi:hypothetical protein BCR39DRAFT_306025 [Naematelia encephala]|uniref:Uncharacterized protein n=1 Tax=Naematelia encephala TaxID=71784 RepID=A0A1Y2ARS0_9TREE|nr:hypothetical protein BCR39DRAFT_306025 [Naematelia encephala]
MVYSAQEIQEARALLIKADFTNIDTMVVAAPIGCIIEALIAGSCLQMVLRYFRGPKRDNPLGRIGIVVIMVLVCIQIFLCNSQMYRLVHYYSDYARTFLLDWFLFNVEGMIYSIVVCSVLFLYAWRAYLVWDRNKIVLYGTMPLLGAQLLVGLGCGIYGMAVPWPLRLMSDDEFNSWIPEYLHRKDMYFPLRMTTVAAQLITTTVLSFLICTGVLRHRGVAQETDNAISRIVFISGESLLPMVVLSVFFVVGAALEPTQGMLLTRVCGHLSPSIYFHGLMTSLVSRERVAQLLNASSIRHLHDRKSTNLQSGVIITSETHLFTESASSFPHQRLVTPPTSKSVKTSNGDGDGDGDGDGNESRYSVDFHDGLKSKDKNAKGGWDVYAMSEISPKDLEVEIEDDTGKSHED